MKITIKTSEVDFTYEGNLNTWDYTQGKDRGCLEVVSAMVQKVSEETIKIKKA